MAEDFKKGVRWPELFIAESAVMENWTGFTSIFDSKVFQRDVKWLDCVSAVFLCELRGSNELLGPAIRRERPGHR